MRGACVAHFTLHERHILLNVLLPNFSQGVHDEGNVVEVCYILCKVSVPLIDLVLNFIQWGNERIYEGLNIILQ